MEQCIEADEPSLSFVVDILIFLVGHEGSVAWPDVVCELLQTCAMRMVRGERHTYGRLSQLRVGGEYDWAMVRAFCNDSRESRVVWYLSRGSHQ